MKIIRIITDSPVVLLLFFIKDVFEFINWLNGTTMQPIDFVDLGIKIFLCALVISYSAQIKEQRLKLKIFNEIAKLRLRNMYLSGIQATESEQNRMMDGYLYREKQQAQQQIAAAFPDKTTAQINKSLTELYDF